MEAGIDISFLRKAGENGNCLKGTVGEESEIRIREIVKWDADEDGQLTIGEYRAAAEHSSIPPDQLTSYYNVFKGSVLRLGLAGITCLPESGDRLRLIEEGFRSSDSDINRMASEAVRREADASRGGTAAKGLYVTQPAAQAGRACEMGEDCTTPPSRFGLHGAISAGAIVPADRGRSAGTLQVDIGPHLFVGRDRNTSIIAGVSPGLLVGGEVGGMTRGYLGATTIFGTAALVSVRGYGGSTIGNDAITSGGYNLVAGGEAAITSLLSVPSLLGLTVSAGAGRIFNGEDSTTIATVNLGYVAGDLQELLKAIF